MPRFLLQLLFYSCDKTPWPKQLGRRKINPGPGSRENTGNGKFFEPSKPAPCDTVLLTRPHLPVFAYSSWRLSIQAYELFVTILTQHLK